MINWQYYPKSVPTPEHLNIVVNVFVEHEGQISSATHSLVSDDVLGVVRERLTQAGFSVEADKSASGKIKVPVLFGQNGRVAQAFDADAWNRETKTVLEIEAGRAVTNYQFLKDLFQSCMMHDIAFLAIAVRNLYKGNRDFDKVCTFFDTLFASGRLRLPLTGVLIVGY